mmetsp:Transcript_92899/g.268249  ORF Transcript_92899/g.268249 Transcript_92899/m.268249 type:complete len:297 (-) Transcript_92899:810-1700(-)
MVVHHVEVLVPHIVVTVQDSDGIDILIAGVGLLDEGVPQVGDGAQQNASLHVREEPVHDAEHGVPKEQHEREAVIRDHSIEQLRDQRELPALDEQGQRAQSHPVKREPGHIQEERQRVRALQVQVGVHVVHVVVPTVVDLHVRDIVVPGHDAVEWPDPPLAEAVQNPEGALEEAPVGMPLLVCQGVDMREDLQARADAHQMVDGERRELQPVLGVAIQRPKEEDRRQDPSDGHPRQVGVVAGVAHGEAGERPRDGAHELRDALAVVGEARLTPLRLEELHSRHGDHDLQAQNRGDK